MCRGKKKKLLLHAKLSLLNSLREMGTIFLREFHYEEMTRLDISEIAKSTDVIYGKQKAFRKVFPQGGGGGVANIASR